MDDSDLLTMTQANLDLLFLSPERESQLNSLVKAAVGMIAREGVSLSPPYSPEDANLIVMYASYLYRKRATDEPMPRMLRWALNNRIFGGEKDGS